MTTRTLPTETLSKLPCCTGHPSVMRMDAAVRYYRSRHVGELQLDLLELQNKDDEVVFTGTHGTLTMRWKGNEWAPAAPSKRTLSAEEIAGREAVCKGCENYQSGADQCRFCGCSSMMAQRVRSPFARCPDGKW